MHYNKNTQPEKNSNMIKKGLFIILGIIIIISLFGFHDIKKPEHSAYVLSIGMDKAENNKILLTLQCMPPNILNKSAGIKDEDEKLYTTSIIADSLEEGVAMAHNYISTTLNFGHVRAVVFSEALAREGIEKYIITLTDNRMNDSNMNIYISKCDAKKFIESISPKLESNPVLYFDLIEHAYKMSGATEPVKLVDFLRAMYDDVKTPIATYCNVTKEDEKNLKSYVEESSNKDSINPSYSAGNIPKTSKAKTEVLGIAVFKSSRLIGTLDTLETNTHLILQNKMNYFYQNIRGPVSKKNIKDSEKSSNSKIKANEVMDDKDPSNNSTSLQFHQQEKTVIKVNIDNDVPIIDIFIPLNYTVVNTNAYTFNYLDKEYMEKLENEIEDLLRKDIESYLYRTQHEFGIDTENFSKNLKGKFLTMQTFLAYNWENKYKEAKFNIKFDLKCQVPGLYKQR